MEVLQNLLTNNTHSFPLKGDCYLCFVELIELPSQ
jgi:hypothetical protein